MPNFREGDKVGLLDLNPAFPVSSEERKMELIPSIPRLED